MKIVTIDDALYEQFAELAKRSGYDSAEQCIIHILEREAARAATSDAPEEDPAVLERLKSLGYLG